MALQNADRRRYQEKDPLQPLATQDLNATEKEMQPLAVMHLVYGVVEVVIDLRLRRVPILLRVELHARRLPLDGCRKEALHLELRSALDTLEKGPTEEAELETMVLLRFQAVLLRLDFALGAGDVDGGWVCIDFPCRLIVIALLLHDVDKAIRYCALFAQVPMHDHLVAKDLRRQLLGHAPDGHLLVLDHRLRFLPELRVF
mmetsp:Transcript_58847/g.126471  ORF Transcript_58847/g.126471 Transcript_58847/m.126471 type:complete len:201 (-) Transcript_58847:1017-1619(-)